MAVRSQMQVAIPQCAQGASSFWLEIYSAYQQNSKNMEITSSYSKEYFGSLRSNLSPFWLLLCMYFYARPSQAKRRRQTQPVRPVSMASGILPPDACPTTNPSSRAALRNYFSCRQIYICHAMRSQGALLQTLQRAKALPISFFYRSTTSLDSNGKSPTVTLYFQSNLDHPM